MKKVLLYSGGLDSVCAAYLDDYDVLLRVPTGAAYEHEEERRCLALDNMHQRLTHVTTARNMFNFHTITLANDIVPNRNAHLVLAASLHGESISLAAVEGDRSCDKDLEFAWRMQHLLDHMWEAQHWTPARTFEVTLPVKHLCKSALLRAALNKGMPNPVLYTSYSCYVGMERACGVCKPCVRKYVAMRACGVSVPTGLFAQAPEKATWLDDALKQCATAEGWRCDGEDHDFLEVFQ